MYRNLFQLFDDLGFEIWEIFLKLGAEIFSTHIYRSNFLLFWICELITLLFFITNGKDDKSSDAVITNVNPGNIPLVGIPSLDKLGEYCIVDFSRSSVYDQWILESVEVNSVYCWWWRGNFHHSCMYQHAFYH